MGTGEEADVCVPFSAMYLLDSNEKRIELDEKELERIKAAFSR